MDEFDLITCIVNHGQGSKALHIAKEKGVKGGTICLGSGTIKDKLLEFLDLNDIRKEIVLMLAPAEQSLDVMLWLRKRLHLDKPNHGIVFSAGVDNFIASRHCNYVEKRKGLEKKTMYNAIVTIVNRGSSGKVIDAANKAGAKGGTVINARGSGTSEKNFLFSLHVEPEKEIVLILSDNETTEDIVENIKKELNIEKPGNGIIFVSGIKKAFGLNGLN